MILECDVLCECDDCGEEESISVSADHNGFDTYELKRVLAGIEWVLQVTARGPVMRCPSCKEGGEE